MASLRRGHTGEHEARGEAAASAAITRNVFRIGPPVAWFRPLIRAQAAIGFAAGGFGGMALVARRHKLYSAKTSYTGADVGVVSDRRRGRHRRGRRGRSRLARPDE